MLEPQSAIGMERIGSKGEDIGSKVADVDSSSLWLEARMIEQERVTEKRKMRTSPGTRKPSSIPSNCWPSNRGITATLTICFVLLVSAALFLHLRRASTGIQWPGQLLDCRGDAINANRKEEIHSDEEQIILGTGADPAKLTVQRLKKKIHTLEEKIEQSITFLPLIDRRQETQPLEGSTWFMSSFPQEFEDPNGFLYFPSKASEGRVLCVSGRNRTDKTQNGYALAWRDHLPKDFVFLPGLSFITEQYYTLENIWHALESLGPFLLWRKRHRSASPDRFVLYRRGELTYRTTPWMEMVLLSAIGTEVPIERLNYGSGRDLHRPVCFDRAVVNRHGFESFSMEAKRETMDVIRRNARRFCKTIPANKAAALEEGNRSFNFTLFTRTGARSFKNESAVHSIFEEECSKVPGCRFRNVKTDGLSFCDQVYVMTTTQVLATSHGAQLTNIVFMEKGSHVMEMYPKGCLELAGPGQYLYRRISDWSGLEHEGDWRDNEGPDCPFPEKGPLECFFFHKDSQVGHNQEELSKWAAGVLSKVEVAKLAGLND